MKLVLIAAVILSTVPAYAGYYDLERFDTRRQVEENMERSRRRSEELRRQVEEEDRRIQEKRFQEEMRDYHRKQEQRELQRELENGYRHYR